MSLNWEIIFREPEQNKITMESDYYVTFFNKLKYITNNFGYSNINKAHKELLNKIEYLKNELENKEKELSLVKKEFTNLKNKNNEIKQIIDKEKRKLERIIQSK